MTRASVEIYGRGGACIWSMGHGNQELLAEKTGQRQSGRQTQGFCVTTTQLKVSCLGSEPKEMVLLEPAEVRWCVPDGLVGGRL